MFRLALLVILCPLVFGLGIAPANEEFIFDNDTRQVEYRIYNTEQAEFDAIISVNGSLAPYVKLDKYIIQFSKDLRVANVIASITLPPPGERRADITVKGSSVVVARLSASVIDRKESLATGAVVTSEEGNSYFWPGLLVFVVIANLLFLVVRKPVSPAEGLYNKVKRMNDARFEKLVDKYRNDLADSISKADPELAFRIYDTTNRKQMLVQIHEHLYKQGIKKNPQELQKEIKELKHELDTFEFSGFEKDL